MTIKILSYDELPDWVNKDSLSNNGAGKEWSNYIVIEDGDYQFCESDAMEPEDCKFTRDLSWIKDVILKLRDRAFDAGWQAGRNDV